MVEQPIGPDIILWGSQMFATPGGDGKAVTWHLVGQCWSLKSLPTITVRVAIDGSTPVNGCLKYSLGSHKSQRLRQRNVVKKNNYALGQEMEEIDFRAAADAMLEPRQISLHDVCLVRGSAENRSTGRRADPAIRSMPPTTLYDRSLDNPAVPYACKFSPNMNYPLRPQWLVRGTDWAGKDIETGQEPQALPVSAA